jgi:hypothetical protein
MRADGRTPGEVLKLLRNSAGVLVADDAQRWLDLADEARALAATMTNPEPKLVLLEIAACYMRLAKYAEQRRRVAEQTRNCGAALPKDDPASLNWR